MVLRSGCVAGALGKLQIQVHEESVVVAGCHAEGSDGTVNEHAACDEKDR